MQIKRTKTGYQLDNIHVDAKPHSFIPTQQARTLLYVAKGLTQKEMAALMGVGVPTVKQACNNLSFKFNTHSMRQTLHNAIQQGILRYTLCLLLCVVSSINTDIERPFRVARANKITRTVKYNRLKNKFLTA